MTACNTLHDPEPYLTYTMQTGSAGGWAGSPKFKPREGYCQDQTCYDQTKEQEPPATPAVKAKAPKPEAKPRGPEPEHCPHCGRFMSGSYPVWQCLIHGTITA